jgi:alanine racemase
VELRKAGVQSPILIQCCPAEYETRTILENNLIPTVASFEAARRFSEEAVKLGITSGVHLDIDTGMGRIGFPVESAVDEATRVASLPNLNIEGIYTHFSTSEIEDDANTLGQLTRFKEVVERLSSEGIRPPKIHAANSGAVINYSQSYLTLVRPGLILYGVYPHRKLEHKTDLRPALSLETSIVFLKDIKAGTSLGYGRSFVADKPMRIATANVGYADGYPWRLSNNARVIVKGKMAPVVGRVSMDQLLIDVTPVPDVKLGDTITLIGNNGSELIRAEDIADWAGTISYEILCGISKRVPREYVE